MNRRMALLLTLLSGGLLPATLLAQDRKSGTARRPPPRPADEPEDAVELDTAPAGDTSPPPNFINESGHNWRTYDIARYTEMAYKPENPHPQNAIIEWIFRRTGSAIWHGDKIAVLSASRAQLRAYHDPKTLKQVNDVVRRFTQSTAEVLTIHVRIVAAADTRWRYDRMTRMTKLYSGPQGQTVWTLGVEDAAMVRAQMALYQGFKPLADRTIKIVNGQTVTFTTEDHLDYVAGPQRDSAVGFGYQPATQRLDEGVVLRVSPLLNYDGDKLDLAIDLRANTIQRLIRTKILTRAALGPGEMTIDVPHATETRLNQTVQNWPIGQTLLISAGITPGILQSKTGFLNLRVPGTVPTNTELLIFLDAEVADAPRAARRD